MVQRSAKIGVIAIKVVVRGCRNLKLLLTRNASRASCEPIFAHDTHNIPPYGATEAEVSYCSEVTWRLHNI
jgi:hypothetical protein